MEPHILFDLVAEGEERDDLNCSGPWLAFADVNRFEKPSAKPAISIYVAITYESGQTF